MTDLLFVDFLNSQMLDGHGKPQDRITDPGWIDAFRTKWHFDPPNTTNGSDPDAYFRAARQPQPASAGRKEPRWERSALDDLLELRTVIRQIVDAVSRGEPIRPADVQELDRFLGDADLRHTLRITGRDPVLETMPLAEGHRRITGAIALSVAEFLTTGDRERLKMCTNPGCKWIYHDDSKNRSRRWCNSELCGNLFKVRRHRDRRRAEAR